MEKKLSFKADYVQSRRGTLTEERKGAPPSARICASWLLGGGEGAVGVPYVESDIELWA